MLSLYGVACDRDLEGVVGKWARRHVPHGRPCDILAKVSIVDRRELVARTDEGRRRSELSTKPELLLA